MKLIALGGPSPAYLLLRMVALWYALADRTTAAVIRRFHRQRGAAPRGRDVYRHVYAFGESMIDGYAFLYRRKSPFTFSYDGEEHFNEALRKGKGLILLTAHMGNWEIAGNLLFDRLNTPVNFIMLDETSERMRRVFSGALERRRISIIPVTPDPVSIMVQVRTVLARNEILCVVGDRYSGGEQTRELPFFGRPAKFPSGPFVFSAITGAPLIAVFSMKRGPGHYHMNVSGTMEVRRHDKAGRDAAIDGAMRAYVGLLEAQVRAYPYQWFNLYDYWGT